VVATVGRDSKIWTGSCYRLSPFLLILVEIKLNLILQHCANVVDPILVTWNGLLVRLMMVCIILGWGDTGWWMGERRDFK
jgi:hypothetical protein